MTGSNPTDRGKLGTNKHVLTDKEGIPLSAVMSSASMNDVKLVTDVVDNAVAKDVFHMLKQRREEKENCNTLVLIKHIVQARRTSNCKTRICATFTVQEKKKRGQERYGKEKTSNRKEHPARTWVVERTNSWHNRFRKIFT